MKTNSERALEALTWAAVVIWLGMTLILRLLNYVWLVVMVLSIILLSSAIYQRSRGWHTSLSIWVFGVWMAVFSVLEVVSEMMIALGDIQGLQIDLWVYLGVALISMGIAVVLRNIQMPSVSSGASGPNASARRAQPTRGQSGPTAYTRQQRFPRPVQDDLSSGYTEPPGGQQRENNSVEHFTQQIPRTDPRAQRANPVNRRRRARPVEEPQDLESRVDDIIRRSRERRDRDNLPY